MATGPCMAHMGAEDEVCRARSGRAAGEKADAAAMQRTATRERSIFCCTPTHMPRVRVSRSVRRCLLQRGDVANYVAVSGAFEFIHCTSLDQTCVGLRPCRAAVLGSAARKWCAHAVFFSGSVAHPPCSRGGSGYANTVQCMHTHLHSRLASRCSHVYLCYMLSRPLSSLPSSTNNRVVKGL